ncbi:MAG: hypothetical protein QME94_16740 [Anaerolineae bacterium]|nr:hypothetical protein [Anaerolineae bacterium]
MSEARQTYTYTHRELAEILVKHQGIHEGLWGLYVQFGFGGLNVVNPDDSAMSPAAIVPITRIGIQRFAEANSMTVDAAAVNPAPGQVAGQASRLEGRAVTSGRPRRGTE